MWLCCPTTQCIKHFPGYSQQLTIKSSGERITHYGNEISDYQTGPIFLGELGNNGHDSFYQLIHMGTNVIPCGFVSFAHPLNPLGNHDDLLPANVLAQSEALAFSKTIEQVKAEGRPDWLMPHSTFEGTWLSDVVLADQLTPETLGKLVALCEHSVFALGAISHSDSFDQWGVELGKALAQHIILELESATAPSFKHDSPINTLIWHYRRLRGRSK